MPEVKQMEILRVKVKGIRNITEAKISFDKITALVGLNGYGKSNIMDAVDFGIDFIPSALESFLSRTVSTVFKNALDGIMRCCRTA